MPKARTTLTVDERLLRAARVEAARRGKRVYEVVEEALRDRYDLRATLDSARRPDAPEIDEDEAMALVTQQLAELRAERAARRAA
jgi:hypothetical protein